MGIIQLETFKSFLIEIAHFLKIKSCFPTFCSKFTISVAFQDIENLGGKETVERATGFATGNFISW